MTITQEIVDKLLASPDSFEVTESHDEKYIAMQCGYGKIRLVYAVPVSMTRFTTPFQSAQLVAIVCPEEQIVYLGFRFFDLLLSQEDAPRHTMSIHDKAIVIQDAAFDEILSPFMESLPTVAVPEEEMEKVRIKAREKGLGILKKGNKVDILSIQETIRVLAGFADPKELLTNALESNRDGLILIKARNVAIANLLAQTDFIEPWEREMAKAISESGGYNVSLWFQTPQGEKKLSVSSIDILCRLASCEPITRKDAKRGAEWDNLQIELNNGSLRKEKLLTCNDIKKITYGRKVLFYR